MNCGGAFLVAAAVLFPAAAPADALVDRDNGPLTGLFGFPDSSEGGELEAPGSASVRFYAATSSHSVTDSSGDQSLLFDGETTRLAVSWRRGLADRAEVGVELPYLLHESGSLDSFIDGWHRFFGLPDGIRDERPPDRLLIRYDDGNGQALLLNRPASGLGDVRIFGGLQLAKTPSASFALRFGVKLPTGDSRRLLGSGGTDVSVGIAVDANDLWGVSRLNGFYRISATWIGRPDDIPARSRNVVAQLSAGAAYSLTPRTTAAVQVSLRSPVYDSAISPMGGVAASLTAGLHFRLSDNHRLTLSVGEDIHPQSLPDVTFLLSLRMH